MKVLGTTSCGFIVEMGPQEIAQIQGFGSTYHKKYREPVVGWVYNVSDSWDLLEKIRESRETLSRMGLNLKAYADLLTWKETEINEALYRKKIEEDDDDGFRVQKTDIGGK